MNYRNIKKYVSITHMLYHSFFSMCHPIAQMGIKTDAHTDFHALISPLLGPIAAPTHAHQMQTCSVSYVGFTLLSGARLSAWVAPS